MEKPGCAGNARQKALLVACGHEMEMRNLMATPWTVASLHPFLGARPVAEWINRAAPQVKSGSITPEAMIAEAVLAAMIAHPDPPPADEGRGATRSGLRPGSRRYLDRDPPRPGPCDGRLLTLPGETRLDLATQPGTRR